MRRADAKGLLESRHTLSSAANAAPSGSNRRLTIYPASTRDDGGNDEVSSNHSLMSSSTGFTPRLSSDTAESIAASTVR